MPPTEKPPHVARLEACERRVRDAASDRAARVLKCWIDGGGRSDGIEGVSICRTDDEQPCRDCGRFERLYYWTRPLPSCICSWCSLNRFKNGGRNTPDQATFTGQRGPPGAVKRGRI